MPARSLSRHACGRSSGWCTARIGSPWSSCGPCPFRIGRPPALHLTLPAESVSTEHAEFYADGDGLRLRDLGSTNGTFVNRVRIEDAARAATATSCTSRTSSSRWWPARLPAGRPTAVFRGLPSPQPLLSDTVHLQELLRQGAVGVLFQPIVELPGRHVVGHEALGRGRHPGLPESPADLFRTAAALGVEVELSRLFRAQGPGDPRRPLRPSRRCS